MVNIFFLGVKLYGNLSRSRIIKPRDSGVHVLGRMMGIEPTASCATNRRSNQLSYIRQSCLIISFYWGFFKETAYSLKIVELPITITTTIRLVLYGTLAYTLYSLRNNIMFRQYHLLLLHLHKDP